MKNKRRMPRSKSRPARSIPPPLPLVFAETLAPERPAAPESGRWETVDERELLLVERPEPVTDLFPLVTRTQEPFPSRDAPASVSAMTISTQPVWPQVAAVLAMAALAIAAVWLPIRPWLTGTLMQSSVPGARPRTAESMVYVVPITVVGQAPGAQALHHTDDVLRREAALEP